MAIADNRRAIGPVHIAAAQPCAVQTMLQVRLSVTFTHDQPTDYEMFMYGESWTLPGVRKKHRSRI